MNNSRPNVPMAGRAAGRIAVRVIGGYSILVDAETSSRMGGIRQSGTSAERVVRRVLRRLGISYGSGSRLPGSPDVANRSKRWALFVHGCFWHRHSRCRKATTPKRNRAFWLAKFEANRHRDARVVRALRRKGYSVCVVWECQLSDAEKLAKRLTRQLPRSSGRCRAPSSLGHTLE